MKIRKTKIHDLDVIIEIYKYARNFMSEHGNPNQWGPTNWPPRELLINDIEIGKSYVCVNDDDVIIGTFFFDQGLNIEPTYETIEEGGWKDNNPYGVIHRLAGNGSVKGIGAFCINWAYNKCKHLRVDTHGDNYVMQNLLNKLGFERRGIIHVVEDNYPRYAYEK